ncbi:acetyltransferase domain-containing protein [Xylariaceae sp. FL0662B]|nr:acetyltransferase domain-containing protein [Xylariaceae sp. FL0662B]
MRLNENIAISTQDILLVPYDAHHVPRYHEWMQDPAIREATASDPLSLDEEFENQGSWRSASDKLTFIVCSPLSTTDAGSGPGALDGAADGDGDGERSVVVVEAGVHDAPSRMLGDVNLFLTLWEEDEDAAACCDAEVDIMIVEPENRGRGLGKAAVLAFLAFVRRNLRGILDEYGSVGGDDDDDDGAKEKIKKKRLVLRDLVVKIKATNSGSIALFGSLGFRRKGDVNYFGEIQMVLEGFGEEGGSEAGWAAGKTEGYRELVYDRSLLN